MHMLVTGGPRACTSFHSMSGVSSSERRRRELKLGPGGDHDIPYRFTLLVSVMQILIWRKLLVRMLVGAFKRFTMTYQTTILPVIQQICVLDGTINADEYNLSRTPPLQAPKPTEDLLTPTEEHLAENGRYLRHFLLMTHISPFWQDMCQTTISISYRVPLAACHPLRGRCGPRRSCAGWPRAPARGRGPDR